MATYPFNIDELLPKNKFVIIRHHLILNKFDIIDNEKSIRNVIGFINDFENDQIGSDLIINNFNYIQNDYYIIYENGNILLCKNGNKIYSIFIDLDFKEKRNQQNSGTRNIRGMLYETLPEQMQEMNQEEM